jgi:hypothetical protein
MKRSGGVVEVTAKKKSWPLPAQAVPSFNSWAVKVELIASCRAALWDCARLMSCGAVSFSAPWAERVSRAKNRKVVVRMAEKLYRK